MSDTDPTLVIFVGAFVGLGALLFAAVFVTQLLVRRHLRTAALVVPGRAGEPFVAVIPPQATHDVFVRWAARWTDDTWGDRVTMHVRVSVDDRVVHDVTFEVGDELSGSPLPIGGVSAFDTSYTSVGQRGNMRSTSAIVSLPPHLPTQRCQVQVVATPRPSTTLEVLELLVFASG